MCPSLADPYAIGFSKNIVSKKRAAGNEKFFGAAVFQKCCRGVGEQPTFAEQITEPNNETKQKSKRESEESQLPSKSKGCNERQGFRGNCDSQASWGCAPALPNRTQLVFLRKRKTKQEVSNKRCIRKYQINLIKFSTVI